MSNSNVVKDIGDHAWTPCSAGPFLFVDLRTEHIVLVDEDGNRYVVSGVESVRRSDPPLAVVRLKTTDATPSKPTED